MKKNILLVAALLIFYSGQAQKIVKTINAEVSQQELKSHLYFIASDELRGRNTGTVENEIAAQYIASRFRSYGVQMAPGADSYFQQVSLMNAISPQKATFTVGEKEFALGEDLVFYTAKNGAFSGEVIYVGYGLEEDLEGLDLEGKIVVAKTGNGNPNERLTPYTIQKQRAVEQAGGVALVELFKPGRYPWRLIQYYFSGEKYSLYEGNEEEEEEAGFPSAWLLDEDGDLLSYFESLEEGATAEMTIGGQANKVIKVPNVVGYIEGTDPKLKEEVIMISAHLDHVGVSKVEGDSIWNGARDNGIGIANMLTAAEFLAKHPPKRSIAFLACNAEEKGLLGSRWYADHPVIPLEKTVYDLNTDTGGYNDVSKVTVVGFNRTSVTDLFSQAATAFNLEAIDDPLPEENYYDRSDNVSFAAKGVPSVSFDPGYTEMNEEITKYYHQPADEPQTLDYDYLTKYSKAYIYAVTLIGNHGEDIFWTEGDKYEPAGKELYGRD
ncbi:M28 family peptidase [Marinoscillum sp.]|uniref:M28 family peptidase n=1 Tax=Marinoscillum sp. TaxID=2024838 RepID=UPI003BAB1D23